MNVDNGGILWEALCTACPTPLTTHSSPTVTFSTSPCVHPSRRDVKDAYLYATTPHMFACATEVSFNRIRDRVRIPMYGCDCYAYGLLAMGLADLVVEADLKPYDYMALVPIVKGAGGEMTDWSGRELEWRPDGSAFPGEVCAAGDVRAHKQAIEIMAWGKKV
jgi:inositol-phosphate phosphatase / L-galactose 1-phosphate phosphatase / histidinol-phosphatase